MKKESDRMKLWKFCNEQISNLKKTDLTKEERKIKIKEILQEYKTIVNDLSPNKAMYPKSRNGIIRKKKRENKQKRVTNWHLSTEIPTFLKKYSKNGSNNPTEAENILYFQLLENGVEFVFQKPIHIKLKGVEHFYIFDFFIPSKNYAIEVDGGYHTTEEQQVKDKERDLICSSIGIKTIRLTNEEVVTHSNKINYLVELLK